MEYYSAIARWPSGKEPSWQWRRHKRHKWYKRGGFNSWVRKSPWRRKWQPIPVFFPEKSHGQRSLVGSNPWGCKELDMTEHKTTMDSLRSSIWKGFWAGKTTVHLSNWIKIIEVLLRDTEAVYGEPRCCTQGSLAQGLEVRWGGQRDLRATALWLQ